MPLPFLPGTLDLCGWVELHDLTGDAEIEDFPNQGEHAVCHDWRGPFRDRLNEFADIPTADLLGAPGFPQWEQLALYSVSG